MNEALLEKISSLESFTLNEDIYKKTIDVKSINISNSVMDLTIDISEIYNFNVFDFSKTNTFKIGYIHLRTDYSALIDGIVEESNTPTYMTVNYDGDNNDRLEITWLSATQKLSDFYLILFATHKDTQSY